MSNKYDTVLGDYRQSDFTTAIGDARYIKLNQTTPQTVSGDLTITGDFSGDNLSGTNTGDQDLSGYSLVDGTRGFTSEPPICEEFTAGENLVAGNVCYLKSDGKYWKALASAKATTAGRIALCIDTISANGTGTFLIRGDYTDSGLTTGSTYYISTSTGGAKTLTTPSSGNFLRVLGWATSTTNFYFDPSKDYGEVS